MRQPADAKAVSIGRGFSRVPGAGGGGGGGDRGGGVVVGVGAVGLVGLVGVVGVVVWDVAGCTTVTLTLFVRTAASRRPLASCRFALTR
jgi:hypothetical protein